MKKLTILLLSVAALISFTQCNNSSPQSMCNDATARGEIISELMNNDTYMNEVMDSMKARHPEAVISTFLVITKNDHKARAEMMSHMMSMCKEDSSMCKMMMERTMSMCDVDDSKCHMMMGAMQTHHKVMKSMKEMCNMKGMKMNDKKEAHSMHH